MHSHLTQTQRIELSLLRRLGHSHRSIAHVLGVHHTTVGRELARNAKPSTRYHATYARLQTAARRVVANQRLRKLFGNTMLESLIESKLRLYWSPAEVFAAKW